MEHTMLRSCTLCFNPERASQAIPTTNLSCATPLPLRFQSRTGFPGHSDGPEETTDPSVGKRFNPERASQAIPTQKPRRVDQQISDVSIPNGLPRPFRHPTVKMEMLLPRVSIPNGLPRPSRPKN